MPERPLFQVGAVKLHSGAESNWKVECDALTSEDWRGLAMQASELGIQSAYDVIGVPRGGIPFANALKVVLRQNDTAPVLVVDDVLTTGGSILEVMARYPGSRGLVAFARGPLPPNVRAIWKLEASDD